MHGKGFWVKWGVGKGRGGASLHREHRGYNAVAGPFFGRLAREWESGGARVNPIEAVSDQDYRAHRGRVGKLFLRWRIYVGHALGCWRRARDPNVADPIRIVTTNPFFAPALVARAACGRGQTVNLIYDLYPDALVHAGVVGSDSWMARRCEAVTRYALRECAATVYLGDRIREYAESTYGPSRLSAVIPVGADGAPFRDLTPLPLSEGQRPRILYCGLMGEMHDSATVSSALSRAKLAPVEWVFHATGRGYARLRADCGSRAGVGWGDALSEGAWRTAMTQAHVALVTIATGAERVVMPSKSYSALVAGQAILAICPPASDLADLVHRHRCGWAIDPGDVEALESALDEIASDGPGLLAKRMNAFEAGHRLYDMGPVALQWQALFSAIIGAREKAEKEPRVTSVP